MKMTKFAFLALAAAAMGAANAGLVQTQVDSNGLASGVAVDGTVASGEYATNYGNGGGSGFGGTLGAGMISMDADALNVNFGFTGGNALNDVVVVYIDSKAGGFDDASMSDTSDGGRSVISNLAKDSTELFPTGFLADYAVIFGSFGSVSFELTGGTHNFLAYQPGREVNIARNLLDNGSSSFGFNWFAAYCSESGWLSNESMPADSVNSMSNPGFNTGNPGIQYSNYNRFEAVPEPATLAALGFGIAAALRRRRK
ncbi:MAG: PEP-CTERM sorting domain-containing protein [Armatimonadetes bacterium]|nr:PEP-CTERM sorting domain-containing protein [Armatimonadota bacterium]